ncbi:hypothetical protein QPK32_23220 [Massilia sp. YIM B02763]|uniref:hypothetical protein n=1 Tax=Massilia sp. YIM B02763 TaxID=3050130 RepID=UPI0025B6C8C1|nr:hypothetical protein [Massilia sp. YIM B02763]MDN4055984.1 hypothetical protein [Massilia sp. YIM B02763]
MKRSLLLALALSCQAAYSAEPSAEPAAKPVAQPPAFYVVDMRQEGSPTLHSTVGGVAAGAEMPYVLTQPKAKIDCCFHVGAKPGARVAKPKAGSMSEVLYGDPDKDEKILAYSGYLAGKGAANAQAGAQPGDIAFGLTGMTAVRKRGRDTWEITLAQGAKPVFVRQCLGIEGIHMRLYRALRDRKPYADYYVPLGYDTEATCP